MNKEIINKIMSNNKNLIINGETNTFKTRNIMFPILNSIIDNNESVFILDPKEEYLSKYYNILKEKNYNIIILNLKDYTKSNNWNPLDYPYKLYKDGLTDKAVDYLEKISKTIFYTNRQEDPFWSNCASNLFMGLCLALFEDGKKEEINLSSIINMVSYSNEKNGIKDYLTDYLNSKKDNSLIYSYVETTALAPIDTKGGILTTFRERMNQLTTSENLKLIMNTTSFTITDKPTAIILITKEETKKLNIFSNLFIEQLFLTLLNNKFTNKFNLILDNFDTLNPINEFIELLNSSLSRNIKFYIITRSIERLITIYDIYILKLCNVINTNENIINIDKNNNKIEIENVYSYEEVAEFREYPKLVTNKIKVFNLKEYVDKIKKSIITSNTTIEKLVQEIDDKIEELDNTLEN